MTTVAPRCHAPNARAGPVNKTEVPDLSTVSIPHQPVGEEGIAHHLLARRNRALDGVVPIEIDIYDLLASS